MIYITGDTHGLQDTGKINKFIKNTYVTEKDILIILGDCGIIWYGDSRDEKTIRYYNMLPFGKILFIDGNHDNHAALSAMTVSEWMGGKTHQIDQKIFHLMRGQVYQIEGETFFTFGGNRSADRYRRTEGIDWWKEELPANSDFEEAEKNLALVRYKVDYVLTHGTGSGFPYLKRYWLFEKNYSNGVWENRFFNLIRKIDYSKWYTGHYHIDLIVKEEKTEFLYQTIKGVQYDNKLAE